MDLQLSNPTPTEPEPEPQTRILPVKPLSFTNGVLKRHPPLHHHPHPHHPIVVTYKECLKNHAANMGAHALDGCGEFMPSPTTTDPTSLKCAACGCHRNFHRREPDTPHLHPHTPTLEYHPQHRHHPLPPPPPRGDSGSSDNNNNNNNSPSSPPPISSTYYPSAPHVLLSLSHKLSGAPPDGSGNSSSRKRHRTRFSHEQKKRMLEFSEGLGWKMLKKDEDAINRFVGEIGVDRGVFKVWMHNNKNNYGTKQKVDHQQGQYPLLITGVNDVVVSNPPPDSAAAAASVNGNGFDYNENVFDKEATNQQHHVQVLGTNIGSSSS